jgi:iron complex outermembrane receptor protein
MKKTTNGLRPQSGAAGKRGLKTSAALLLGAMSCVGIAHAQPAGASADDEIVVTARRREELAQTVPLSVNAIGSETLEDLNVTTLEDVQALEPSLTVSPASGRPNHPVYSLRGIRPTEAIYGQDPTVAVYLADVVQSPAQGSNLGMYDLESVQVLKGPQGTLFGRNTVGGAILLTPRRPDEEFGVDLMLGAGSFGLVEGEFGLDVPFAENFRVRLVGRMTDSDGHQTLAAPSPNAGQHLGGETINSGRLVAVWDMTPTLENVTTLYYDSLEGRGPGAVLQAVNPSSGGCGASAFAVANCAAFQATLARARSRDIDQVESDQFQGDSVEAWGITNTTTYDLSDTLTFKSIIGYRSMDSVARIDLDSSVVSGLLTGDQWSTLEYTSAEFQLLGESFGGRLSWVTGLYYYSENGYERANARNLGTAIIQSGDIDNSSYSIFGQGSYEILEDLTLTVGARWNYDEREMTRTLLANGNCGMRDGNPVVVLPNNACFVTSSGDWEQPTGTISLDYQVTDEVMIYAASRLGYRSGGFNLRGRVPVEYQPFDPETVTDFELGMKSDWSLGGWGMRTNVALFYQEYDDIQRTVSIAATPPGSVVTNAAAATTTGLELQQTIRPTDNLTFQINYAYNNPEFDEWLDAGVDLSSTPFAFTPENSGNIMVRYEAPIGDGEFWVTANASYMGDHWINPLHTSVIIAGTPAAILPLLQQEEYWMFDLSAGFNGIMGSNADLTFYVKNVTDERYVLGGIQLYHSPSAGFINAVYNDPRTAGVQLRYRFE